LIDSWFKTIPKNIASYGKIVQKLKVLWENYITEALEFLREQLIEPSPTSNN